MDGEALTHGGFIDAGDFRLDLADVRHRQAGIGAEQRFHHPCPADDGRCARAVGRDAVNRRLRDQSAAMRLWRRRHFADGVALHAGDSVEARDPFIDGHEVALDQTARVQTRAQNLREKPLRLADDRDFQMPVVFRVERFRRRVRAHLAKPEPLPGEVLHKRLAACIGEHPIHLRTKYGGLCEFAARREFRESFIGHR